MNHSFVNVCLLQIFLFCSGKTPITLLREDFDVGIKSDLYRKVTATNR